MTPEEHWTEHAPRPRRPRLGPILHRVAAELPHISEAKGMRMEGGTRLAFLSFTGVQNARTLVVHAAEPTSKSVSLLALGEAFLRAAVAAAGWTRGPVQHDQVEAAGPLARWLGPRGSSVACKRRLSRSQWAETLGWLVSKLRLVGDKDSELSVSPVQAVPPTPIVEGGAGDGGGRRTAAKGDLAVGIRCVCGGVLWEIARWPRARGVAVGGLGRARVAPPSPAEEGEPLYAARGHLGCFMEARARKPRSSAIELSTGRGCGRGGRCRTRTARASASTPGDARCARIDNICGSAEVRIGRRADRRRRHRLLATTSPSRARTATSSGSSRPLVRPASTGHDASKALDPRLRPHLPTDSAFFIAAHPSKPGSGTRGRSRSPTGGTLPDRQTPPRSFRSLR